MKSSCLLALLTLIFGGFSNILAQTNTASISGVVMDERQALIPNATVTVRNLATNFTRTVQTDSEGRYRVLTLSIGNYEVNVEAAGFAKYKRAGITLALNQDAIVDVQMKPSTVTEAVSVTENASLLNTSNAEIGVRFDSKRI